MRPVTTRNPPGSAGSIQVRVATAQDMEQLLELASQLLTQIHAEGTVKDARRVFERTMKSNDLGVVLVAEQKTGLCGYAYAAYEWRAEFGGETMDIVALWVEQQWRSKGVGGSLLSALLDIARQRGIRRISTEVHPNNAAIERTLESNGFDPERRTLWSLQI
jgi:GNAT superfamily N-acetyltransferase